MAPEGSVAVNAPCDRGDIHPPMKRLVIGCEQAPADRCHRCPQQREVNARHGTRRPDIDWDRLCGNGRAWKEGRRVAGYLASSCNTESKASRITGPRANE